MFRGLKVWIMLLSFLMNLSYLFKQLFMPAFPRDNIIQITFYFLKYAVSILLCYYFIKRSGQLVNKIERTKYEKLFRIVALISSLAMLTLLGISIGRFFATG